MIHEYESAAGSHELSTLTIQVPTESGRFVPVSLKKRSATEAEHRPVSCIARNVSRGVQFSRNIAAPVISLKISIKNRDSFALHHKTLRVNESRTCAATSHCSG
jgi:hypothetical protein